MSDLRSSALRTYEWAKAHPLRMYVILLVAQYLKNGASVQPNFNVAVTQL